MFTQSAHAKSAVSTIVIATLLFGLMASTTHAQTTSSASASTISALQAQLQSLKDTLAKMLATATVGETSTISSNNVQVGDRVQTTAPLNVRDIPSATGVKLATAAVGAMGTVLAGPAKMQSTQEGKDGQIVTVATADYSTFWQVKYDSGVTGWSSSLYLRDVSSNYGVTTGSAATCDSFAFSPSSIQKGQSTVATWHTTNATKVTLVDATGTVVKDLTGLTSYTLTPDHTSLYTIRAVGSNNTQASCVATVTVKTVVTSVGTSSADLAVCDSMSFSPANVKKGATATLSWHVTGASQVYLDPILGKDVDYASGSYTITADKSKLVTLSVMGTGGVKRVLCSAQLVVQDVVTTATTPICNSFFATPSGVNAGSATTLKWDTTNAARVTIDSTNGYTNTASNLPVDGSVSVTPKVTGEYYLSVYGTSGTKVTCTAPVQVIQPTAPAAKCNSFTFTPSTSKPGRPVVMAWSTSNGVRAVSTSSDPVLNNYDFPLNGTYTIYPIKTTTNSLTVFGSGTPLSLSNQDTCYATMTVTN